MAIRHRPERRLPWQVYWNNPNSGRRESRNFLTEKEAKKHNSTIKHRLDHEPESFAAVVDQVPHSLALESLVMLYLRDLHLKPANLYDTISHVNPVFATIGQVLVSQLDKAHMRQAVSALKAQGNKQNTINRRIGIIKAALNWAEDQGLIPANPVARFKCPRGEDTRIAPPTRAEVDAILSVAPEHVRRVVVLGLALGVRVGESEMFGIKWADVDLARNTVRVWAADKNEKRPWRDLDLRADLVPLLRAWREDGAETPVHFRGKAVGHIGSAWRSTLARAGITRRIRPYDLRHAFATYALDAGADPKAVSEVMGHADMSMIHKHYQHVLERQRKAVMDLAPMPDMGMCPGHILPPKCAHFCVPSTKKSQ